MDKEKIREAVAKLENGLNILSKLLNTSIDEESAIQTLLKLAELYLADKLCEPIPVDEIVKICSKWYRSKSTHSLNDLAQALVGKVPKQSVPASVEEIEKILNKYIKMGSVFSHDDYIDQIEGIDKAAEMLHKKLGGRK
jgi:hypothetical protein